MMTKKEKKEIIKLLESIDVKKITIEHQDEVAKKWFRFGSYIGLDIASQIINDMPERKKKEKKVVS